MLIRGDLDQTLWSGSFDREVGDVLARQRELAQTIAQHIEGSITGVQRSELTSASAVAPDVYETYLKALFELRKLTRGDVETSIVHFEGVVKRDATFAPAYLGLGEADDALGSLQVGAQPASDMRPKAIAAVQRAFRSPRGGSGLSHDGW